MSPPHDLLQELREAHEALELAFKDLGRSQATIAHLERELADREADTGQHVVDAAVRELAREKRALEHELEVTKRQLALQDFDNEYNIKRLEKLEKQLAEQSSRADQATARWEKQISELADQLTAKERSLFEGEEKRKEKGRNFVLALLTAIVTLVTALGAYSHLFG